MTLSAHPKRTLVTLVSAAIIMTSAMLSAPALAQGTLFVVDDKVGIGTDSPTQLLHVKATGSAPAKLFFETGSGLPRLEWKNGDIPETWFMDVSDNSDFRLSVDGSGQQEMKLSKTGNMTIAGTLTQNSDVNAKHDIDVVDGSQVLEKLTQLPISEWTYKADADGTRHLGPMAQDFYSVFELGNDSTKIAPGDMAGVSLAAIKALQAELDKRDQAIENLAGQIAVLQEQVQSMSGR